jgi:hypothetical protein
MLHIRYDAGNPSEVRDIISVHHVYEPDYPHYRIRYSVLVHIL